MKNIENTNEEYGNIIKEVSEKFGYSEDLTNVLNIIVPAMLDELSSSDKQLFYKMLRHTPIVIIPEDSEITDKQLQEKYIGNVNPHIQEEVVDIGEYGKVDPAGAFVSEPIIDENLNIKGTKQFLYVGAFDTSKIRTEADRKQYEKFGTGIRISYLIHELGHAFVSEKEPYTIEGNVITQRCGTAQIKSEIIDLGNGKYSKKEISREGLMTEEALNTNFEEKVMAKILGLDLEETKKLYKGNGMFVPSSYQGLMSEMTEYMQEKFMSDEIWQYRLTGDKSALGKINEAMSKTAEYKKRGEETEHLGNKREIFGKQTGRLAELFEKYHEDFFPDKENMSPMQIMDNCLLQCYNVATNKMSFPYEPGMKTYADVVNSIIRDGYVLINQTANVIKEKQTENNITINSLTKNALSGIGKGDIDGVDNNIARKNEKTKIDKSQISLEE